MPGSIPFLSSTFWPPTRVRVNCLTWRRTLISGLESSSSGHVLALKPGSAVCNHSSCLLQDCYALVSLFSSKIQCLAYSFMETLIHLWKAVTRILLVTAATLITGLLFNTPTPFLTPPFPFVLLFFLLPAAGCAESHETCLRNLTF